MGIYLETERLCIRDHKWEDIETHHKLLSDEEVMYYLQDIKTTSWTSSRENLMKAMEEENRSRREHYFFRIEDKITHEHIGEIGYTITDFTLLGACVNLGYFSYKKYWNKGYMTEAVNEVLRFAFEENHVYRVATGCLKENKASERVMQKCGFTKEGELKKKEWHDGQMRDRVIYRMLKEEWLDRTGKKN